MTIITSFMAGLLFAMGLVVSGMTVPARVIGFLDVTGAWDPTLAFVMGGALLVYAPLFRVIIRSNSPLATAFQLPSLKRIDARLLIGAALFGIGWGLAGMCPGPALVVAGSGTQQALLFVAAMVAGAVLFDLMERWREHARAAAAGKLQEPVGDA